MRIKALTVLLVLSSCAVFSATVFGQEFRGGISGSVTDSSGAAVPKVKVVATEVKTGVKSSAVSESSGGYTIPYLIPGEYEVTAEASGFKRFVRTGITLSTGEHPVIDIRMEVGAVTESVTVHAETPLLVSGNASVGQIITTAEVEDFPVNGRTPAMLANLAFGVVSTFEPGPVRPFDNGAPNAISVGGSPSGTSEMLFNGAPNGGFQNQMAYSPPQDAVMEVRISTFEVDAAQGHTDGGSVNVVSRGGTNQFHGSAYDFNQSSVMDANGFFNNLHGVPRPAYHYNQFGMSAGGPVWIPKVFNGRNKVFWFFAYEGLRDADPATSPLETGSPVNYATVPTAAERKGDFSALLGLGSSYQLYDPSTGVATTSGSTTTITRQPFPNNIIPAGRLDKIAQSYLQFFPQPNAPGQANGFRNYIVNATDKDTYDNEFGRLDFNISDRQRLSVNAWHNYRAQDKNNYFGNIATGTFLYRINQGFGLDDVYTITPRTVMDVHANWTRYMENRGMPSDGFNPATLGFPSYVAGTSEGLQLPAITFTSTSVVSGSQNSFQSLSGNGDGAQAYDSYQIFGDVTMIRGNHVLKAGGDAREYRWSAFTQGNSAGAYTFGSSTASNNFTNGPTASTGVAPLGGDFAAFLLGQPSSGSFDLNTQSTSKSKYFAMFLQDDWRMRPNLTINLGLRWEHETPTSERFNRAVDGFDPTAVNSISATAAAAYAKTPNALLPASQFTALGGPTFASASNPNLYSTAVSLISPHVGLAWTPAKLKKTVIRGGFGVFIAPIEILGNGQTASAVSLNQQGFSQTTSYVATNNNFQTPANAVGWDDPFPTIFRPVGSSNGPSTYLGQALAFYTPQAMNSYSMRWNFGIQRELPGQIVVEVAYIGNHAVHLPITGIQLNYVPRKYLSNTPYDSTNVTLLQGSVTNPLVGLLPNGGSLNGKTVALDQILTPYPQYPLGTGTSSGLQEQGPGAGESYYHSLNVRVQKRFTNGLVLLSNFVYDRLTERVSYLNDSDSAPEKRIGSDSRPLREVLALTYKIPAPYNSRWAKSVFGGWAINSLATFQSGPVIGWGNLNYLGGPLNYNAHQPNGTAFDISQFTNSVNVPTGQKAPNQPTLNIRAFDTQFNDLRRDPTKQWDASLLKDIHFGEQRYLQLRFEAFNVTNRVGFGAPSTTATSTSFGQITTQASTPRRLQIGARLVW